MRKFFRFVGFLLIVVGVVGLSTKLISNNTEWKSMNADVEEFFDPNVSPEDKEAVSVIELPKLENRKVSVIEPTGNEKRDLKVGALHLQGSTSPDDPVGNSVYAAHNDRFFKNLTDLEIGDVFYIYTNIGKYKYTVYAKETIAPTQVNIVYPKDDPDAYDLVKKSTSDKQATLITCTLGGKNRETIFGQGGELVN